MKRKGFELLVILSFSPILLYSQAKIQNLFFNSTQNVVKLNFSTATPSVEYTNVSSGASIGEGIAHVEDQSGNIILWVNSSGVYDKAGVLMPGSEGILAHPSNTEIVVCPFPSDTSRFYIFYNQQLCSQLYYSIVNMNLREGYGDVTVKNEVIDGINEYAEGLEIVKVPCSRNYWLLTYRCDIGITRFQIDEKGISEPEVINELNTVEHGGRGELDYHKGKLGYAITFRNKAFVADFNPVTGAISNPLTISFPATNGTYGLDFSPDASKVYVTDLNNKDFFGNTSSPNLFRYDFKTSTLRSWTITNNGKSCGSLEDVMGLGQIEIGKDQNLYIPHIGACQITVIKSPDAEEPFLELTDVNTVLSTGISDHIQSDFLGEDLLASAEIFPTEIIELCDDETTTLSTEYKPSYSYQWVKNGEKIKDEVANILNVNAPGKYRVEVVSQYDCKVVSDEKVIEKAVVPVPDLGEDIQICEEERLELTTNYPSLIHEWSDGSNGKSIEVRAAGVYRVKVSNGKCYESDTIKISYFDKSKVIIPNIITPNGDAFNENLVFRGIDLLMKLEVYNRWGNLVYQSEAYQNDWNGASLISGIYYYYLSTNNKCLKNIKGWVQILK